MPKLGDFFIGVIDFFAILVPGVLAAITATFVVSGKMPEKPEPLYFVELLVAGFILGHVLHGIGSFLDPFLYDRLFKPSDAADRAILPFPQWKYVRANDELYQLALAEFKHANVKMKSPPGGMYQWARVWLRLHSPEATTELDRLEADSKLFRSLAILGLALVIAWTRFPHWVGELPLTVAAIVFSVWRYCDLRQKMVRSGYLHYIQLRSERAVAISQS
jgi:hypothetical protein